MERTLVYTDQKFIDRTRIELKKAQEAQQKLLDQWNATGIGIPCDNLFKLMHTPQKVYGDAVKSQAEIPIAQGKFQISKEVFLNMLDVPVPNELYTAAREARNCIQSGRPELWSIKDNKTVVLNETLAEQLIHSFDVYAENEAQKEVAEACLKYMESSNFLNDKLKNMAGLRTMFGLPFTVVDRFANIVCSLDIEPTNLREMLKTL